MSTPNETPVSNTSAKPSKRRRALGILGAVVLIGGGSWFAWHMLVGRWHQDTDDAYVQGNIVTI
ncbi:MAG TPA: EmrA/EmrK family multidrug efflux transporter periplasmic adaptor subunit, partial [Lysobacter sp.]|nr:EmrA/EmrK family multidrug efflux transporter periplasmic adaptor subunit [Lysobacter sp.]